MHFCSNKRLHHSLLLYFSLIKYNCLRFMYLSSHWDDFYPNILYRCKKNCRIISIQRDLLRSSSPTPLEQAGSPRPRCTGPYPDGFWAIQMETLQSLQASHSSVWTSSELKRFYFGLEGTSSVLILVSCPISRHYWQKHSSLLHSLPAAT